MSPRIDHRPPVIAFLVLVVLAIAVVGTNARAVDRVAVAVDPIGVQARVTGAALTPTDNASSVTRVRPVSRSLPRPVVPASGARAEVAHRTAPEPARHLQVARHGATRRATPLVTQSVTRALTRRHTLTRGFLPVRRAFGLH